MVTVQIEAGIPGSVCVDSSVFAKSVRKSSADFKIYEFNDDTMGSACSSVTDGNGSISERTNAFATKDASIFTSFDMISSVTVPNIITIAPELKTAISLSKDIMDSTITNDICKYMTVELDPGENCVRLITTNGTQITRTEVAATLQDVPQLMSFSLSIDDIATLFSLLSGCAEDQIAVINLFDNHVAVAYPELSTCFAITKLNVATINWRNIMSFTGSGTKSFNVKAAVLKDMVQGVMFSEKTGVQQLKIFVEDGEIISQSGSSIAGETIKADTDSTVSKFSFVLDAAKVSKAVTSHKKDTSLTFTECGANRLMITPQLGEEIPGLKHFSQVWSTII
jgi:hypothetical protein